MAYTEFYCQNGGSNLNAGSTNNNTAAYTGTGNWANATAVFTPTDGSTPASTISVGDWVSVYVTGATVGVYIARVTVVGAGVNGAITTDTAANGNFGTRPANQTGTATLKAGGAWLGPNAASGFPFTLFNMGAAQDTAGHDVRVNLKNDQTYSITAAFGGISAASYIIQGYGSSLGDGSRAILSGGTSTGALINATGAAGIICRDMEFVTTITSGTASLVISSTFLGMDRCVVHGARVAGIDGGTGVLNLNEVEVYDCNKSNTASSAAVRVNTGTMHCSYIYIHDCVSGSNANALGVGGGGSAYLNNAIFDSNGGCGILMVGSSGATLKVAHCDFYNNTGDAIKNLGTTTNSFFDIRNCNFIKNGGAAINNAQAKSTGYTYNNAYGAGTQANGSSDTYGGIEHTATDITLANDVTPWVAPSTGNFSINLPAVNFAGRGVFTETDGTNTGTVGHPDIGSAQSLTGSGGTFTKEVSYASAY